jgi:hypothetical protein
MSSDERDRLIDDDRIVVADELLRLRHETELNKTALREWREANERLGEAIQRVELLCAEAECLRRGTTFSGMPFPADVTVDQIRAAISERE